MNPIKCSDEMTTMKKRRINKVNLMPVEWLLGPVSLAHSVKNDIRFNLAVSRKKSTYPSLSLTSAIDIPFFMFCLKQHNKSVCFKFILFNELKSFFFRWNWNAVRAKKNTFEKKSSFFHLIDDSLIKYIQQ